MQTCDVLIVGGGPAGTSCARALSRAGMDILLLDKAVFPRDKVCAGWVTPVVFAELEIDPIEYSRGRICQLHRADGPCAPRRGRRFRSPTVAVRLLQLA